MTPNELSAEIRRLLATARDDKALRGALEALAEKEISFGGFTWLWGPELYKRNRVLFRPFIMTRFSTWMRLPKRNAEQIKFKKHSDVLEPWLTETDRRDDVELFRKLYDWKINSIYSWSSRDKPGDEIRAEISRRLSRAATVIEAQTVLRKFDLWFTLDERTALAIVQAAPKNSAEFILKHLPNHWFWGESARKLWRDLFEAADEELRWKLYRRQVSVDEWRRDIAKLARDIGDPATLCAELNKRHLEGWQLDLTPGVLELLRARGRDVFPYVVRNVATLKRGLWWRSKAYKGIVELAEQKEWWDLWSGLIRVVGYKNDFNKGVARWLDSNLPDDQKREHLLALAGVSREWNLPGLGLASVQQLDTETALALYEKFPDLVRGPIRQHVSSNIWGESYIELLDRFFACDDEEMIDLTASRLVTRWGRWGNAPKMVSMASKLADYYLALKSDEKIFARRAGRVLGLVPAYSFYRYDEVIKENRLARLFFERSLKSMLADRAGLLDLVEASEIHVQQLAYRTLAQDDPRAREVAAEQLPLLLGTLLRPLHRATRKAAFGALANAAQTPQAARTVLERAREALVLPDEKYPKEELLGLIARVLHQWPELRNWREQPVIYERAAA